MALPAGVGEALRLLSAEWVEAALGAGAAKSLARPDVLVAVAAAWHAVLVLQRRD
jgi:hypothetical protein